MITHCPVHDIRGRRHFLGRSCFGGCRNQDSSLPDDAQRGEGAAVVRDGRKVGVIDRNREQEQSKRQEQSQESADDCHRWL